MDKELKSVLKSHLDSVKQSVGEIDLSLIDLPDCIMRHITRHKMKDWDKLSSIYNKEAGKLDEDVNKLTGKEADEYVTAFISWMNTNIEELIKEEDTDHDK